MPNISETLKILDATPIDQATLLEGIHGIGKSECISEHFKKQGYKMIVLFLGQLADAGDVLGLPDRVDSNGIKKTEFCPPGWWPTGPDAENAKIVLFLDEINRAKPELQQVIMDLVLNRKLHGRELPKYTRIIAAQNPIGDGEYQVEELDPALLDRFNKYEFRPDVEEWIDWASRSGCNKNVIDFIYKQRTFLDPPGKEAKSGQVTPSRRSWKRVSDILNQAPKLADDANALGNILFGVVGMAAASAFTKFLREQGNGLSASKVLTGWDKATEAKVRAMDVQDQISVNRNIVSYLREQEKTLLSSADNLAAKVALNLQFYLDAVPAEVVANYMSSMMEAHNKKEKWPGKLLNLNNKITTRFVDMMKDTGDDKKKR